jgi:hypothetical protein
MSDTSNLAAKYARQLDHVEDMRRTVQMAQDNLRREAQDLDAIGQQLKSCISRENPKLLVQIGGGRYVLVHCNNGSFGVYSTIEIIEETK